MNITDFHYEIYYLSDAFYSRYDKERFPEILEKSKRAYNCLVIKGKEDYYICIPYRTEITHKNGFRFKNSKRSIRHKSGLDYSKIVIVKDIRLIGGYAVVDSDEYKETRKNIVRISREASQYIDEYICYQKGASTLSKEEIRRRYQYATLKYFHSELGLNIERKNVKMDCIKNLDKATAVYFSPTGNSKKTAVCMAETIGKEVEEIDVTVMPLDVEFTAEDFVVFAAPVYAGRIPNVCRERFEKFKGHDTPCILIATYGNREFDDALLEMADMFKAQGFVIKGAAGLVGRHTYGEIQVDRPNNDDLEECRQFTLKACENIKIWPDFDIPGNRPYREGMTKGSHHPTINDACIKCGLCVRACPVQAIDEDCETVKDNCISCFRCIRNCPVGGKEIVTESYIKFAKDFTEKLKERKENSFFL